MSYDIQLRNLNIPNTFTKDTDIREILSDIQANFEILKNSSLWKGEKGDSLTPKIVNLDALVDSTITNETPFNTLDSLKTLYLKLVQPIIDQSSDQTSFGDRRLLWVLDYLNPAATPSMKENIKNSHSQFMPGNIVLMVDENNKVFYSNHYVFVDPRFRNNLATPPNNQQDLSCALLASPEGADYKFTAYNAFPQVAYNRTTNTYTWKMNGVVTAIPVMGQKGEPGKSVNNQFVIVTRKEGGSGDIFKVSHIGTRNLYISGDTKVDNYAEIIKEYINKPAFILPGLDFDPTKKGNNLWVGSTALSSDGKDLIVYCSEDNRLDLGTNVKNLFSVMMDMGAYKNYPINDGSTPARGIIFPMYRNEQERDGNRYFMMYSEPQQPDGGNFGNELSYLRNNHKNIHTIKLYPFKDTEDLKLNRPGISSSYVDYDGYYGFDVGGLMRTQVLVATGAVPVISEPFYYKDWSNPGDDYKSEDFKRVHIQANDGGVFGLCGVFGDNDMKSYYGKDAFISGNLKVNGGLHNYGAINTYPLPSNHNLGPNVGRKGGVVVYDDQYRKKPGLLTGDGDVTYEYPIFIESEGGYKPVSKKYTDNGVDFYDTPSGNKELVYLMGGGDFAVNGSDVYTLSSENTSWGRMMRDGSILYTIYPEKNILNISVSLSVRRSRHLINPHSLKFDSRIDVKTDINEYLKKLCKHIKNKFNITLPKNIVSMESNCLMLYLEHNNYKGGNMDPKATIKSVGIDDDGNLNVGLAKVTGSEEFPSELNMGYAIKMRVFIPSIHKKLVDTNIYKSNTKCDIYVPLAYKTLLNTYDLLLVDGTFRDTINFEMTSSIYNDFIIPWMYNNSRNEVFVGFDDNNGNETYYQELENTHDAVYNTNISKPDETLYHIEFDAKNIRRNNKFSIVGAKLLNDPRVIIYSKNEIAKQNDISYNIGCDAIINHNEIEFNDLGATTPFKYKATLVKRAGYESNGKWVGTYGLYNLERLN